MAVTSKKGQEALKGKDKLNTLPGFTENDTPIEDTHNTVTQQTYTMPKEEIRNKRLQIVVKPSVNKELDRLVRQKKIKSKNDLVNFLLEQFIEQNK